MWRFEMKLWLIFAHPRECLVGMLLYPALLWWGMRVDKKRGENGREMRDWGSRGAKVEWGRQRQSLWSPYGLYKAARGLVILPFPCPPSPLYHPQLTMTNRICSLSNSHRLPPLFFLLSYPPVLISFVIYPASVLVSSQGQAIAARLGHWAPGPGKEETLDPPVPAFRKPFNWFRRIC